MSAAGRLDARPQRGRHALWGTLALIYAAFIFILSEMPGSALSAIGLPAWLTNLAHAPLYAGLATLVLLAFGGSLRGVGESRWPTLWTLGAVGTYALSDELHQRFVPGRDATLGDLGLDLVGTALALGALNILARRRPGKRAIHKRHAEGFAPTELLLAVTVSSLTPLLYALSSALLLTIFKGG